MEISRKVFMKKIIYLLTILFTSTAALASDPSFLCSGQAEYNKIIITQVLISKKEITIQYRANGANFSKSYITTEFLEKNGSTDLNKSAYFIGGTKSGLKKDYDDISLPHFGQYRTGLGSEIAFNHDSNRVFGTVDCQKK